MKSKSQFDANFGMNADDFSPVSGLLLQEAVK